MHSFLHKSNVFR